MMKQMIIANKTPRAITVIGYCLLVIVLASCSGDGEQMRQQLEELERQNRADSVMTNDTLAERLVKYFDRHGTPNERMRAHYLMGRTWADMGDYPNAVEAFLTATYSADTMRSDCDFFRLSRVYGQMSNLFYKQHLLEECLENLKYSSGYAWKANDTTQALTATAFMIPVLFKLHQDDKAISLYDTLYAKAMLFQGIAAVSRYCMLPVEHFLETKDYQKAKEAIECYETYSCYFDSCGNIEKGREVFYYYKGLYYLNTLQYDSAEFFFRKELREGHDFNNQNAAARGLALLYHQINRLDSAVKYSLYSYAMNDSSYNRSAMEEMQRARSLYDYRHHKNEAQKEKKLAERRKKEVRYLVMGCFFLCLSTIVVWLKKRRDIEKYNMEKEKELEEARAKLYDLQVQKEKTYNLAKEQEQTIFRAVEELQQLDRQETSFNSLLQDKELFEGYLKEEQAIMREQGNTLHRIIAEKMQMISLSEKELAQIKQENAALETKIVEKQTEVLVLHAQLQTDNRETLQKMSLIDEQFKSYSIYNKLHNNSTVSQILSEKEWDDIEKMLMTVTPGYYGFMAAKKNVLNKTEYRLCHLLRLHLEMKIAGFFAGVSQTHVSRACSTVLGKLFHETGAGKKLQKRLEHFF